MKQLIFVLVSFFTTSLYGKSFDLDSAVYKTQSLPFLSHSGPGKWDSYLIFSVPFPPVADLFKQLLIREARPLTSRGEAHITVVTPVEFWELLRPKGVSMKEIEAIAKTPSIQGLRFKVVCLGQGTAKLEDKIENTYYAVVESPDLIALRQRVQELFVKKGGKAAEFNPKAYYPHITLGFTKRDLHESDGVVKGKKTCIAPINIGESSP
jgi:2'-5' RNA ligase